jgi:protein-L-isoaspartate O-methyltransferase
VSVTSLVRELDSAGDLPAGFGPLLHKVPRELFVPHQIWAQLDGPYQAIDRDDDPELWLRTVYSDTPLVTQFDDGATTWPQVGERPTCSGSAPSVLGAMLAAAQLQPGHAVLEIGTGTGFTAALLAESVAPGGRVSSVEVDSTVMAMANEHLWQSGYRMVRTVVGDGALGDPGAAPFDRVIATASVQAGHLPYAWVEQTRPGGLIVAPMRTALSSGPLVVFRVNTDGTATGRAHPMGVGFMELRAQRTPSSGNHPLPWQDSAEVSDTEIDPVTVLSDPHSRWALALALPSCRYDIQDSTNERPFSLVWLRDPLSRSWATLTPSGTRWTVHQDGPRRLWDELAAGYRYWTTHGRPSRSDWSWTITPTQQTITLET